MVNSNASRFGKKAMSLFLSGAMVVAFAPAIGAVVSEPVAAFAEQNAADVNAGTSATELTYRGTTISPTSGKFEVAQSVIDDAVAAQAANADGSAAGTQNVLTVTGAKLDSGDTIDMSSSKWTFSITKADTTVETTAPATITLKNGTSETLFTSSTAWTGISVVPSDDEKGLVKVTSNDEIYEYTQKYGGYIYKLTSGDVANGTAVLTKVNPKDAYDYDATNSAVYYKLSNTVTLYEDAACDAYLTATGTATSEYKGAKITVPVYAKKASSSTPAESHFYYDGNKYAEDGDTVTKTYDGTNKLADITVRAMAKDGTVLTQGVEYDVVAVTNSNATTATNIQVTEAVDTGYYTVYVVDPATHKTVYASITLYIKPAKVVDAAFDNGANKDESDDIVGSKNSDVAGDNETEVTYTGSAIEVTPTFYTEIATFETAKKQEGTTTSAKKIALDSSLYTTKITFTSDLPNSKPNTVTEVKETGKYVFECTLNVAATGAKNYNMTTVKFTVNVVNASTTYLELDSSTVTFDENGYVLYSGTSFTPGATLYTTDTKTDGSKVAVPTEGYRLVLKKATTVLGNNTASGYQTVDAVNGPGYYQLTTIDTDATDGYSVDNVSTYFYVTEKAEEPVVVEKQDQDIKFTTGKNQKLKKGKKLQLKVTGAKTAVTYTKKAGSAFLTVTKSGKIKVDSSAKKGKTYHINVKAKAAASDAYNADTEVKHFCIKVK